MAEPTMEENQQPADVFALGPIAKTVGSQRLAVFEMLTIARRAGLTIPQIVSASGVPNATAHRIIKEFTEKGLVVVVSKEGKAPVYGLNAKNKAAIETARSLMDHARRIAVMKAGEAAHGGAAFHKEQSIVTVHLPMTTARGSRGRPRLSFDVEVEA